MLLRKRRRKGARGAGDGRAVVVYGPPSTGNSVEHCARTHQSPCRVRFSCLRFTGHSSIIEGEIMTALYFQSNN